MEDTSAGPLWADVNRRGQIGIGCGWSVFTGDELFRSICTPAKQRSSCCPGLFCSLYLSASLCLSVSLPLFICLSLIVSVSFLFLYEGGKIFQRHCGARTRQRVGSQLVGNLPAKNTSHSCDPFPRNRRLALPHGRVGRLITVNWSHGYSRILLPSRPPNRSFFKTFAA